MLPVEDSHALHFVIFQLKPNQMPFPAVTFCNMNPFKKSPLQKIPALAELMNQYQEISNKPTTADNSQVQAKESKRKKRAPPNCDCSKCNKLEHQTPYQPPWTSVYARLGDKSEGDTCWISWDCGITCCSEQGVIDQVIPKGYTYASIRLAHLNNQSIIDYLNSNTVINDDRAWIGMKSPSGLDYKWYDGQNACGPAVLNPMCSHRSAGPGLVYRANSKPIFCIDQFSDMESNIICECKQPVLSQAFLNILTKHF